MIHELWEDPDSGSFYLFVTADHHGDAARSTLSGTARLTWTVEAASNYEAMTKYWEHQGWGEWTTDFQEVDRQTYAERGWE